MSSPAASNYKTSAERIKTLREAATDRGLRPRLSPDAIQVYYHAALAAHVAAWEAYINNLVRDFYDVIANPLNPIFNAVYTIAQQAAENALKRFNTPNSKNTRDLLAQHTGYDPTQDWIWPKRRMIGLLVRERLNEILDVRHSFAHGFDIPDYDWTRSPGGNIRLTSRVIQEIEAFFKNLVKVTDNGMKAHIESTYGLSNIW